MKHYQALARKYRPSQFAEVIGQDPIIATLKNGIRLQRTPHALLLSGSRGTGKTTLARLLAKALNCQDLSEEIEPCNQCSSCKEIFSGNSLDVLEIDGASHRGIDDIRKITEGVGYSTAQGRCKIYIIDEVHMLTREAFNALLKTLEEPPAGAKFIFATTEPHKVPATIISRCQRFHLMRISTEKLIQKLQNIAKDLDRQVTDEAYTKLAEMAEGGLRDAESLFDQVLSFNEGKITESSINEIFGWMDQSELFLLDQAGKEEKLIFAFELADQLFSQGKHFLHFVAQLTEHFRKITKLHLGVPIQKIVSSKLLQKSYLASKELYRKEQALQLFEHLIIQADTIRFHPHPRLAIETLLLKILRSHHELTVEEVITRLENLEQPTTKAATPQLSPSTSQPSLPRTPPQRKEDPNLTEDPEPNLSDLPPLKKTANTITPTTTAAPRKATTQQHETLIQFAAIELEGTIKNREVLT